MNLAQLLNALENLAPQPGLEEGLDGWERLHQQQMANEQVVEQEEHEENSGASPDP